MGIQPFRCGKINGDAAKTCPFEPEHRGTAGIAYPAFSGIPVPEAYEIVNNLNRNQAEDQFAYYLAEWLNGQVR